MVLKELEKPLASETAELIFQRVYENRGKITGLELRNGQLEIVINNCCSEEIVFDMACSISYKSIVHGFEVVLPVENIEHENREKYSEENLIGFEQNTSLVETETFLTLLKENLEDRGASVQTVLTSQAWKGGKEKGEIIFLTESSKLQGSLRALELICNSCYFHETGFSIYVSSAGCFVKVIFEKGISTDSSLSGVAASYVKLFECEYSGSVVRMERKRIGSIRKRDGSLLVFFKSPDGRILSEMGA